DPRTGEILVSDIQMYHNVLNLLKNWYFTQVAPLDPRAQRLPLPDSLMGELLRYVVAHEVGHTLGLQHNMKASSMYPADSIRNVDFLRRMGHVPSIMDYSRFNYVAQPEDNIPPELLIPQIGPYDKFAIRWGYRPVPGVKSAAEARAVLDEWAREQDEKPWLRFNTSDRSGAVVGELTEAVGDADVVNSTRLGLKNIRRIVPMLIPAAVREGEDFSELSEVYQALIRQWSTELRHVISLVGGVEGQEKYGGQEGVRFQLVPAARQKEAVAFLNEEAFQTPTYLLDPEIMRRIEVKGTIDRITRAQANLLGELMHRNRIGRMLEFEAVARKGEKVYTAAEMLADVRRGIWSELSRGSVRIDATRRALQNAYLDQIDGIVNPSSRVTATLLNDIQALYRRELRQLDTSVRNALPRAGDELTRAHLEATRVRIARILDPK
ncbi:MAG TPA: zinc-dependent metalloprotease, partial [Longimicrobiales bacterium]|nr:zinc-dependent metalloprotease [Longimicrobiales bacterium]